MNPKLWLLIAATAFALTACPSPTPTDPPPSPTPPPGPPPPAPPAPPPAPPPPAPPAPPPPAPPSPPAPPPPDTTAPTIVSITPNNGSIGVNKSVKIVVDFSEAMNRQATELAYQSTDMPAVTFTWSNNDTRLEIDPTGDLDYTATGKLYTFRLSGAATDLAGNALTAITSNFTTYRELTRTFKSVGALDGWVRGDGDVDTVDSEVWAGDSGAADNAQYKGFLSFNLSPLETDGLTVAGRITSATLRAYQTGVSGNPYNDLSLGGKHLIAAHVDYGAALNAADFNTPILHDLGQISANGQVEYKDAQNALESVRDDWTNRTSRSNRSQYVLYFAQATDGDGNLDIAKFASRDNASNHPELEVKFLVP